MPRSPSVPGRAALLGMNAIRVSTPTRTGLRALLLVTIFSLSWALPAHAAVSQNWAFSVIGNRVLINGISATVTSTSPETVTVDGNFPKVTVNVVSGGLACQGAASFELSFGPFTGTRATVRLTGT